MEWDSLQQRLWSQAAREHCQWPYTTVQLVVASKRESEERKGVIYRSISDYGFHFCFQSFSNLSGLSDSKWDGISHSSSCKVSGSFVRCVWLKETHDHNLVLIAINSLAASTSVSSTAGRPECFITLQLTISPAILPPEKTRKIQLEQNVWMNRQLQGIIKERFGKKHGGEGNQSILSSCRSWRRTK